MSTSLLEWTKIRRFRVTATALGTPGERFWGPVNEEVRVDILELINSGEARVAENDEHYALRASAVTLLAALSSWRGYTVVSASPAGERIIGAAMMLDPTLCGGRSARTAIVDVNIASGTLVANAARRIRQSVETESVVALVLQSLIAQPSNWPIEGIDQVVICGPETLYRTESSERSNYCLVSPS